MSTRDNRAATIEVVDLTRPTIVAVPAREPFAIKRVTREPAQVGIVDEFARRWSHTAAMRSSMATTLLHTDVDDYSSLHEELWSDVRYTLRSWSDETTEGLSLRTRTHVPAAIARECRPTVFVVGTGGSTAAMSLDAKFQAGSWSFEEIDATELEATHEVHADPADVRALVTQAARAYVDPVTQYVDWSEDD